MVSLEADTMITSSEDIQDWVFVTEDDLQESENENEKVDDEHKDALVLEASSNFQDEHEIRAGSCGTLHTRKLIEMPRTCHPNCYKGSCFVRFLVWILSETVFKLYMRGIRSRKSQDKASDPQDNSEQEDELERLRKRSRRAIERMLKRASEELDVLVIMAIITFIMPNIVIYIKQEHLLGS